MLYALVIAIELSPLGHITVDVIGEMAKVGFAFLASFLLYFLCRWLWRKDAPLFRALSWCAIASYVLGVAVTFGAGFVEMRWAHQAVDLHWSIALIEGAGTSVILEGWCVLYFGIKHYLVAQQQRARVLASEATARDAQLMALHYQLQPHFLFNTLNAISTLVVSRQPEKATEMISRLAGLLRNTLSSPCAHTVTLREELAVVEEYLTIERVRFGSRLRVSLDASDEAGDAQVPRFLLQPLVENAIRHGIAQLPQGGEIAIKAWLVGQTLQIEATNDTGTPEANLVHPNHGVGLTNTRARLDQLYGTGNAALNVADQLGSNRAGRFTVSLRLPLILDPISRGSVVTR